MGLLRKKHPVRWLLLVCYAGGLGLLLLADLAGFALNRLAYAKGDLVPAQLAVEAFELVNIEDTGNGLLTLTNDPQLVLKDSGRRVENVRLEVEYQRPPLLVNVFWAAPGQDHSVGNMAYPRLTSPQELWLPSSGVQGLRIDPGTASGNLVTVKSITINTPRPFLGFFIPTAGQVALLAVLPGLCAAALVLGGQALEAFGLKKAGDARG